MLSKKYASPLYLFPKKSLLLLYLLLGVHTVAAVLLLSSGLPVGLQWSLLASLPMFFYFGLFRLGWVSAPVLTRIWPRIEKLVWDSADEWFLTVVDGREYSVQLLPDTFLHPRLTILNFKVPSLPWYSRFRWVFLAQDSENPHILRRLRIRLRYYANEVSSNDLLRTEKNIVKH